MKEKKLSGDETKMLTVADAFLLDDAFLLASN
jgi:hypothetical protein